MGRDELSLGLSTRCPSSGKSMNRLGTFSRCRAAKGPTPLPQPFNRRALLTAVGRALRVLVVDDHPCAGAALCWVLRLGGHEVVAARGGPSALRAASFRQRVVVFDVQTPGADLAELARRLRQLPGLGGVALVATPAVSDQAGPPAGPGGLFDACLRDPLDLPRPVALSARPR